MMKNDQSIDITGGRPPRRRRFVTVVASIAALAFFAAACSSDGSGASAGAENDPAETSVPTQEAVTPTLDEQSQASLDTVLALMGAMGSGDMETMGQLIADDMVWQNEGDKDVPWIGPWVGKEAIFGFLQVFSDNFETKLWENEDFLVSGDTVAGSAICEHSPELVRSVPEYRAPTH